MSYFIGEALLGNGPEVAHVDLLIGDKAGSIGQAFAEGFTKLTTGHTPLLAVIRPNLPPKPKTLIVPKVTVANMDQASKIFGPAQYAVAKAIADSLEEEIIPRDKADEWVIICSVFIHPEANDLRKIYHFNYGATKLAVKRALSNYPSIDKIEYEKDRAIHPIYGIRVPRLWRPPYLSIALDVPDLDKMKDVAGKIPKSDRIIFEIGTSVIKKYGVKVINEFRSMFTDVFIMADLKTFDDAKIEVDEAFEETADGVIAAGAAGLDTLNSFIDEADRLGIYSFLDMRDVPDIIKKLKSLESLPNGIIFNVTNDKKIKEQIKSIKASFKGKKILIGVQGVSGSREFSELLNLGCDLIIVSRYITQSRDVRRVVEELLNVTPEMKEDIDLKRVHIE